MARFRADEADNYGGQGGAGFFQLRNDGDVARVRFMYNSIDDVEGFSVHTVEINGRKRYVNCLRDYNQPIDECPFCKDRQFVSAKLFIPIYDEEDGTVKVWERGKKFFSKITSLCARYPDVVSHVFEIERNGKPGDTQTTYEIYEVEHDDTTLEDLPEVPNILGGLVLDKTPEEMQYYLENGEFESEEQEETPKRAVRRRQATNHGRRTPANTGRRNEDAF